MSTDGITGPLWRFRLLGELEVWRGAERVPVTSRKHQLLLAALLVSGHDVVSHDRLAEVLWSDRAPVSARNALQTHVMRLRRTFDGQVPIHTHPDGYVLKADLASIDVHEFRALSETAERAALSRDAAGERAALSAALGLWRGSALSGMAGVPALAGPARALEEQRLHLVERRAALDVDAGQHHQAVAELRTLVHDHPLRDAAWETLIRALHASGNTAQALRAFQDMRRVFRDELGIEPNARVQLLHREILAADRVVPEPGDTAVTAVARPGQLPMVPPGFVGRGAAADLLVDRLSRKGAPLAVVSGPPGMGKTAFALLVAHRVRAMYPDGQLYVDLHGHSPDEPVPVPVVLARFLRALGVAPAQVPEDVEDQAGLFRSLVAGRRVLLVLDNAAGSAQVRPLLPGTPGGAVIVTSRDELRGLAVDGAHTVRLGPLSEDEALAVLSDGLGADRVVAESAAVASLVRACAGLPLALRIAAANLGADRSRRLADYVAELHERGSLEQLRVPGEEQVAVRAAFDLSYDRLPDRHARLFSLLGLVPGPDFTPAAAAALAHTDVATARQGLDALLAANLIMAAGAGRYRIHDLLREYAAAKASAQPGSAAAAERLWTYYVTATRAAARVLHPELCRLPDLAIDYPHVPTAFASREAALDWLNAERTVLVAAVHTARDRGVPRYAGPLTDALRGFLWMRGSAAEVLPMCAVAEETARAVGDLPATASAVDLAGLINFRLSRFAAAREQHERALAISRNGGDLVGQVDSLHNLGRVSTMIDSPSVARHHYERALALADLLGDIDAQARNSNYVGSAHHNAGEFDLACEWHLRTLSLARRTSNHSIAIRALGGLGNVEWCRGNLRGAVSLYTESIELAEQLGNLPVQAVGRIALAETLCDAGDYERARAEVSKGLVLSAQVGDERHQVSGMEVTTTAMFRSGQTVGVADAYRTALREARRIAYLYGEISLLIALAAVHRHTGEPDAAVALLDEARQRMRDTGYVDLETHALVQLGHAHHTRGDLRSAAEYCTAALTLSRKRGTRLVEARALHLASLLEPENAGVHAAQAQDIAHRCGTTQLDILPAG